jgi:hypothetical protein
MESIFEGKGKSEYCGCVQENRSLLLRAICREVGGALVGHYGLQRGGANDVEALARLDVSSQLCSNGSPKA